MTTAAAVACALPFLGALIVLALGGRTGMGTGTGSRTGTGQPPGEAAVRAVAVVPVAASAVLAAWVAVRHGSGGVSESSARFTPTGALDLTLGMRVDGLAALTAVLVSVVALLVQIYSTAYLRDDPRYPSYAALVSLFTAAMLLVVFSADLVVLLVGWEVMGVCSYFLIGHHWETPDARSASIKAFLVTKLGDVPFVIGILVLGAGAGSFRIGEILAAIPDGGATWVTAGTLLLLGGVAGKSAQAPLQTWLPDAMAGPTPVSALIHAATMVAAGAYVVARLYPAFLAAHATLVVLAVMAAVTMIGAGLAALAQRDLKRVLAWSTVGQLAYLTGALAVGGRDAAVLHLLVHGSFKALLFLAAGVVIHAAGTGLLAGLGGARDRLVAVTMTAGLAALAGLPPLSGFFGKEAVLGAAEATALGHDSGGLPRTAGWIVLVAGLVAAALTGAYAARVWLRLFGPADGRERPPARDSAVADLGPAEAAHLGPAPAAMRWPLVVLAVPTVLLGFAGLPSSWLPAWLGTAAGQALPAPAGAAFGGYTDLAPHLATSLASVALAVAGIAVVALAWRRDRAADPARVLGPLREPALRGLGADRLYAAAVVRPVLALAALSRFLDREVVDAYVRGSATGARLTGGALRHSQNGNVRAYLTGLLAAVVVLTVAVVVGT